MHHHMKTSNELVHDVVTGAKYITVRDPDEWRSVEPGDTLVLENEQGKTVAVGKVMTTGLMTVEDFVGWDPDGHQSYPSANDLAAQLTDLYDHRSFNPYSSVYVITWRLMEAHEDV